MVGAKENHAIRYIRWSPKTAKRDRINYLPFQFLRDPSCLNGTGGDGIYSYSARSKLYGHTARKAFQSIFAGAISNLTGECPGSVCTDINDTSARFIPTQLPLEELLGKEDSGTHVYGKMPVNNSCIDLTQCIGCFTMRGIVDKNVNSA